jgi:transforming growth factor-beta-induced protein
MRTKLFYLLLLMTPLFLTNCEKEMSESITETPAIEEAVISTDLGDDLEDYTEGEVSERFFDNFTFFTLSQALECTGLTDAVFSGNKTLYAPSDAAFKKLGLNRHNICSALDAETLTNILVYHVADEIIKPNEKGCVELLDGNIAQLKREGWRRNINDSRIYLKWTQRGSDYRVRVYGIDQVLTPPTANIATTANSVDIFASLYAAVLAADPAVAAALTNEDAVYTVFAPTNEAFGDLLNALGFESLPALVEGIGVENLTTVLLYHVVDGCAFSNDLRNGLEIETLQGESVEVDLKNLSILDKTGDPSPLVPGLLDVLTSNGIVHGINKVLLPDAILNALAN